MNLIKYFLGLLLFFSCQSPLPPDVSGCMDRAACNYNKLATIDDGSCAYSELNYDCNGECSIQIDCAGICGGISYNDNCDVCDSDTANDCTNDCLGVPGGNAVRDCAGICQGNAYKDCGNHCCVEVYVYNLDGITFKVSASKGLDHITYYDEIKSFPFIYDPYLLNVFDVNEIKYSFMGGIDFSLNDDTNFSFSYETYNIKGSLDYILSNEKISGGELINPLYLYSIERNGEEEVIDKISIEINTSLNNNFNSSLSFIYNIYEQKEVFMPVYLIEQVNTYSRGKLDVTIGGTFEIENYGLNFNGQMFKMSSYIDIFSDMSYQVSDNLNVSVIRSPKSSVKNPPFIPYCFIGGIVLGSSLTKSLDTLLVAITCILCSSRSYNPGNFLTSFFVSLSILVTNGNLSLAASLKAVIISCSSPILLSGSPT